MTFQDDDEVVISGIGGKFPNAENVVELTQKLLAGESLVTRDERKFTKGYYENLPHYNGKTLSNPLLFDNTFFGISQLVSSTMDPLTCQILQRTFEAVIDAGINPAELRGTNAMVSSGSCLSDSDLEWATVSSGGYGIMGRNRCMNSNRISYWLDLNGPSSSTDSGWTNGISNLFLGYDAIKSGRCDTALISTACLQDSPLITQQVKDFGILSPDGITRTFDDSANGVGRSSAVIVLVLQRGRLARRSYATIGHVYSACFGDRDGLINKPSQKEWEKLFREFYRKAKIDINDVQYIEAHGASKKEEDAEELNAITEFFCKDRKTPLLIGCVKSNMGHTEASEAFCGIVKSIIALETGMIPQNLNYKTPNSLCPGLVKGRLKVVEKNTPLNPDAWIAVNAYGFGGTYGHIVLKANPKNRKLKYEGIPRLVLLADRTNDYMSKLLEKVEAVPFDLEFIGLLQKIHSRRVDKYLGRGYTILPKAENPIHEHQVFSEEKRPVWFIFSGMGSQWPKMGKRLMDLPIFRESIEKSHKLLEEKGLDLIHIITTDNPNIFDNILHSFVGIAAIQVALVDVLRVLNITPDGFIGHSVGELGCAYADGCFSAEQMVLAAYYRGKASTETELIRGSMAAVGKGYNDIKDKLPDGVEVACHNSEDSCTLSGPTDLIEKYVAELKEQGVFARSVNVSNIAYHSRYIKPAAPKLLAYLKQVVKDPKLRSSKWISTSNPESQWDTEVAKYCSAEYHTNNLLSSVLFEEGSKHIPKNAICIEIAPHGLLQAILKRSLGEKVTNIPLTNRNTEDPLIYLLQAIGKMYMAGVHPNIVNLYPKIEFPVSRGTHVLHHLVHWHEQVTVEAGSELEKKTLYSLKHRLTRLADSGVGYTFNKQDIYPLSIFLEIVWEIFAISKKSRIEDCPVVFENFRVEHPLTVHLLADDNVRITFSDGSGRFEFMTDHLLASGTISLLKEKSERPTYQMKKADLVGEEVYKEIKRKGYIPGDYFKNISAVSVEENEIMGEIPVKANWIQTIESLFQLYSLKNECPLDSVAFPRSFDRMEISSIEHMILKNSIGESINLTACYDVFTNTIICGGIRIKGLKSLQIEKTKSSLRFPSINFVPLMNPPLKDSLKFAHFCFSMAVEDIGAVKNLTVINIMEAKEPNQTSSIGLYLQELFWDYKVKVNTVTNPTAEKSYMVDFIITPFSSLEHCIPHLVEGGFAFVKSTPGNIIPTGFNLISKLEESSKEEYLLLKMEKTLRQKTDFLFAEGNQADFINTLQGLTPADIFTYVVSYKEPAEGIASFKERLQAESVVKLRWIFVLDPKAPKFDRKSSFYLEQLKRGLYTNIYKNGSWGCYCEYNFSESSFPDHSSFSLEWGEEVTPSYVSFDLDKDLLKLQKVEYSGMVNNTKVMGISQVFKNKKMIQDKYLTWEVPDSWSLEDAASVPMSYALAYYCLLICGKLKRNETVMVTDGLTCIGQAAIAVALKHACRVFVTVNDEKETALIKKLFPQVNEKDIICHRDPGFDLSFKLHTQGVIADVIISTLEDRQLFTLLECSGYDGRVFQFGRKLMEDNTQLGTALFLQSISLESPTPEYILRTTEEEKKMIHKLMTDGIKKGVVKPLPRNVVSFSELNKMKSNSASYHCREKTLLAVNTMKPNEGYVSFDISSSYVVIGDETDIWTDIIEWLINKNVQNIVVSYQDTTKRSELFISSLRKHKNVFLFKNKDVPTLLQEAQKLGPISAVYFLSTTCSDVSESLLALDKSYRNSKSFLFAITKSQGRISELCRARNNSGFPSTNFVWGADEMIINEHLEFMGKLCGRDPLVNVSPLTTLSTSDRKLADLLPPTIDDFCDLGSSLQDNVRVTQLSTLSKGSNEVAPLIFIPGLQKEPVKMLQPVVRNFMYPTYCVQIPNLKLSLPQLASCILPEIIKLSKGRLFNIIGISWGTNLAIELARVLEGIGATVGLLLIDGPFLTPKTLLVKSLEADLLTVIKRCSNSSTHVQVESEVISEKTWERQIHKTLNILNLPSEKEKDFSKATTFIYNNLRALLSQDTSAINIKGPLNIILSREQTLEEKLLWKLCKSISVRSFNNDKFLTSNNFWQDVHGSAVSQPMDKQTIYECSWPPLEAHVMKRIRERDESEQSTNLKFYFTLY